MILPPLIAAATTLVLTGAVRRYALRQQLYDHPNHRSLHTAPTPRGGGILIVISVLGYVLYATLNGTLDRALGIALGGGGVLIAAVGSVDDVKSLSAQTRLTVHFIAAVWAVLWLGGLPFLDVGFGRLPLQFLGGILAVVLLVWITNLYNFMDGIDGLAGVEALFLAGAGGLLLLARGSASAATLAFVVFGAALGFLYWNWEPARIFMGDVGSGFLGFTFGTLAIWSENSGVLPLLVWFILAGAFFMDASITIARRLSGGLWRQAHRTHAYQRAVLSGFRHSQVVLIIGACNLLLATLATLAVLRPSMLFWASATSVALTGLLYFLVERRVPFSLEQSKG